MDGSKRMKTEIREDQSKIMIFGYNTTIAYLDSQHLWLFTQELNKSGPVKMASWKARSTYKLLHWTKELLAFVSVHRRNVIFFPLFVSVFIRWYLVCLPILRT